MSYSPNSFAPTSHAEIERALSFIPADLPRKDWIAIGDAIKTEGLDFSVFDNLSATGDGYQPKECRQQWNSFKGKHTAGTIFFHAKQYGYKPENNGEKPDYQAIEQHKAEQAKKAAEQAKAEQAVKVLKTSDILEEQKTEKLEKIVQTNVFSTLFTHILGFLPRFLCVGHNNPAIAPHQAKSAHD
jgi:hypothetical protein